MPATDLAVDARQHHDRVDGDGRRVRRGHRAWSALDSLVAAVERVAAVVPRRARRAQRRRASAPASTRRTPRPRARRGRTRWVHDDDACSTRGTVVIDVEACKGCDLCIDACPPRVLVMTDARREQPGYRYPLLRRRVAPGARRARRSVPTSCSRSTSTTQPDRGARASWRTRHDRAGAARRLGGDRRCDGRGRLPVLRRLPDDAVHRGARAHGRAAARRSAACA